MSPAAKVDKSTRRWVVAEHEAAHVVIARALGWHVRYARITGDSGDMDDAPPAGRDPLRVRVESAVISLAGTSASARGRLWLPYGCGHDQADARTSLRATGTTYADAKHRAARLVSSHWGQIQRTALHLYLNGRL